MDLEKEEWDYCTLCRCPVIRCESCANSSCNASSCEQCHPKFQAVWKMQNEDSANRPEWYNSLRQKMDDIFACVEPPANPFEAVSAEELIKEKLLKEAREAAKKAYCPYSKFHVGSSLLAENEAGEVRFFQGCNVENASYGLTICAERTAIFKAISEGFHRIRQIAVACPDAGKDSPSRYRTPCGACRQVIQEFGDEIQVHIDQVGSFPITELLHLGFKL